MCLSFAVSISKRHLIVFAVSALAVACGDPSDKSGRSASAGTAPALFVQLDVSTPEQPASLVGAFPALPSGELNTSKMIEVTGYPVVRSLGGYVYIYSGETGVLTRYAVTDAAELIDPVELSFATAASTNYLDLQLLDRHIGYAASSDGLLIEFDPTEMSITRTLEVDLPSPVVPSSLDSGYGSAKFDGAAVWNIYGNDYDTLRYNDQAMVGFLEPRAKELQVAVETHCAPNLKNYAINGDCT